MHRNLVLLFAAALLTAFPAFGAAPAIPFGSHSFTYAAHIKPSTVTQAQLDTATSTFYNNWKAAYLQSNKCLAGHYRILYNGSDQTVSEAHGYGMLITVLMAGHDAAAQTIFDGMYWYYKAHPASGANRLLAWKQDGACNNIEGPDSASDGDLDVAMALVMADRQWGSCGPINYKSEAIAMINQVKQYDLNSTYKYVKLGSWATSGNYLNSTRSSDFMPSHYRSFQWATGDAIWSGLINHTYYLVSATAHATTGLIPDFISSPLSNPVPAPPFFLESANDGDYNWNACRDPWRLATDYLASGDARAKSAIDRMSNWVKVAPINGNANNVRAGYQINGTALVAYGDRAFTVPFAVGAMGDASNQTLLNSFWGNAQVGGTTAVNYFGDSIKMLCMIVISGNWWQPEAMPDPCAVGTATATRTRTPTSTPTRSPSPTATGTATPSASLTRTPTTTATATRTASPSATFTVTPTRTRTASQTQSSTPSFSPSFTPSSTPSASPSRTATRTATTTWTSTPSPTPSLTRTPTSSPTATPTRSPTPSATPSSSVTMTFTEIPVGSSATATPTVSSTVTLSGTPSASPSRTATSSSTKSPSPSPSSTPTGTATPSATLTPSPTVTLSSSPSPSPSPSPTPTASGTLTQTASGTGTPSATQTGSGTLTSSTTSSPSATRTPSATATPTLSSTPSRSATPSASPSASPTGSPSSSPTASPTPSPTPTASGTPAQSATSTPSVTATSTSSLTPIGSLTFSQTASPTFTPVVVASSTPGTGGPLKIESVLPMPNPNPTIFYAKLSGWADQIELRLYSNGYHLITTQVSGPHYPGWTIVYLPADFLQNAQNGTYFYSMVAKNNSGVQSKAYKGKFAIYR